MDEEDVIEEKLFGRVLIKKRKYIGDLQPDLKKLSTPMNPGGFARVFCRGCGKYSGIVEEGAKTLTVRAREKNPNLPPDVGRYFVVSSCYACNDSGKFENPEIVSVQ